MPSKFNIIRFSFIQSLIAASLIFNPLCSSNPGNNEEFNFDKTIPTEDCQRKAASFATAVADFNNCSISNSRPIKLCLQCVQKYLRVLQVYKDLEDDTHTNETSCKNYFVNWDHLEILKTHYVSVTALWENGKCDNCFVKENQTITTADTKQLMNLQKVVWTCFSRYQNGSCGNCTGEYQNFSLFSTKLERKYDADLCIDVVDLINRTRSSWSKDLNCVIALKNDVWMFLCMTIVGALLPILFYVFIYFFSDGQEGEIIHLKRFVDTIAKRTMDDVAHRQSSEVEVSVGISGTCQGSSRTSETLM